MWAGGAAALSPIMVCANSFIISPNHGSRSRMYFLVFFQHGDKFADLSRARLCFLHRLNTEQDRIAVSAFQSGKECLCPRTLVQRSLKVLRHSRVARRVIGLLPASILFSTQYLLEPAVSHPATFQQRRCLLAIELRPDASLAARSKSLQPCAGAFRLLVCVDPSKTERGL